MKLKDYHGNYYLTEQDAHYIFWKHLMSGGLVYRNDKLNGVAYTFNKECLADPSDITRFGYMDLTCVPKELEHLFIGALNENIYVLR
jgi:hypothetical protein